MSEHRVILKPGKEKALGNRHHWIFSGAVQQLPTFVDGEFLPVYSAQNDFLGIAYFNHHTQIIGRMVSFEERDPLSAIFCHLEQAIHLRETLFKNKLTTAFRLVNGEGDLLPGLIIDQYDSYLVIQISTLGMERILPKIIDFLQQRLSPKGIYEKSSSPSRKEEGLAEKIGLLAGASPPEEIEILENGLKFKVSIFEGQKTGFFLDHREMRQLVEEISPAKKVLNCFSYTGGFTVYAAAGGASLVDSVDLSSKAIQLAKENCELNGFTKNLGFFVADVFHFLREKDLNYDVIILDPPAFAKKKRDLIPACRGYKDINRLALQKMPAKSLLLTSSCSYYVDADLFQKVIFQAAIEAKRTVKILERHRLAHDHPINICHPETDYLKSLLLYVE